MKKNIIFAAAILAALMTSLWTSNKVMRYSDEFGMLLENVEALTEEEGATPKKYTVIERTKQVTETKTEIVTVNGETIVRTVTKTVTVKETVCKESKDGAYDKCPENQN